MHDGRVKNNPLHTIYFMPGYPQDPVNIRFFSVIKHESYPFGTGFKRWVSLKKNRDSGAVEKAGS